MDDRDHVIQASQGLTSPEELTAGLEGADRTSSSTVSNANVGTAGGGVAVPEAAQSAEPPTPRFGARVVLAIVTLALIGFSLALGVQSFAIAKRMPGFYTSNVLGVPGRNQLLLYQGLGLLVPVLASAVWLIWKRRRAAEGLVTLAQRFCPLLLAGFLPGLYVWELGQRATLQYLFILVAVSFAAQFLWRISLPAWSESKLSRWLARPVDAIGRWGARTSGWLPLSIVVLMAGAYAWYTGYYSLLRHRSIQTFAFDLGIYDNLMYGALSGKPFKSPVLFGPGDFNYLAGHAEYGMLLFLPFYALKPGAETMLIIQSVVLGFAAVPLFLFARTRLRQAVAVVVAAGYLLFAPLHGPNFYDFHWLPLAVFFHFWLYFALATRRTWLAVSMVLVLLSMREDIAMGLCVLGAFLAFTGERVRFGVVLSVVSVCWFGINKFVIMRLAGTWWFENMYAELFADGQPGYGSVLKTLLSNPTFTLATLAHEPKLTYIFHLLAPLAFLPVRRVVLIPLLLPGFFFTLLTTGYWPTTSIAFQYTTHWIPYLFLGTVLSLWLYRWEDGGKHKQLAALLALALALTSHSYNFGAVLQRDSFVGGFLPVKFKMEPDQVRRYQALSSLLAKIPRSASVAATEFLNPHISARVEAYTFRYEVPPVDYILVSRLEVSGDTTRLLGSLLRKAEYGLLAEAGQEFYLFKKGAPGGNIEAALSKLGVNPPRRKKHR